MPSPSALQISTKSKSCSLAIAHSLGVHKLLNTRCDTDGLPCTVPRERMGIWLYADNMESNQEEITMCEFYLQKEVRGPPIYTLNLPRPTENWTNLNKHSRKNLPGPILFPISSVPQDPTYYSNVATYNPVDLLKLEWRSRTKILWEFSPSFQPVSYLQSIFQQGGEEALTMHHSPFHAHYDSHQMMLMLG